MIDELADALGVEPEHFREYRLRVITERLEQAARDDRPAVPPAEDVSSAAALLSA